MLDGSKQRPLQLQGYPDRDLQPKSKAKPKAKAKTTMSSFGRTTSPTAASPRAPTIERALRNFADGTASASAVGKMLGLKTGPVRNVDSLFALFAWSESTLVMCQG